MNSAEPINNDVLKAGLERQLQKIRQESLLATRSGDFRKVAQLTREAVRLNEEIKARSE